MKRIFSIYQKAYSGLPAGVWMLSVVMLINRSGSMVLFFMTLYLTRQLGFSVSTAGQMISIYGLGSVTGAFIGGWLSDRLGTFRIQLFSLTGAGGVLILLGYATTPPAIAIMLFFLAVIAESFRPANAAALSAICPAAQRSRAFALNRLAANLGITIGPAVGGYLATIDYHLLFWTDGLTSAAAAVALFFCRHLVQGKPLAAGKPGDPPQRSPFGDRLFLSLLCCLFVNSLIFIQLLNTWPIYMRESYLLPENEIGLLIGLNAAIIVLFEMPLIHRLENHRPLRLMALGGFLLAAGFSILPLGGSVAFAALTVSIWTVGEMLIFPIISGYVANRAADRNRGRYMGMMTVTYSLAMLIGPTIGTLAYEAQGAEYLWLGAGVFGTAAALGMLLIDRRVRGTSGKGGT